MKMQFDSRFWSLFLETDYEYIDRVIWEKTPDVKSTGRKSWPFNINLDITNHKDAN